MMVERRNRIKNQYINNIYIILSKRTILFIFSLVRGFGVLGSILKTTVDEDQHSKLVEKYRKVKLANDN